MAVIAKYSCETINPQKRVNMLIGISKMTPKFLDFLSPSFIFQDRCRPRIVFTESTYEPTTPYNLASTPFQLKMFSDRFNRMLKTTYCKQDRLFFWLRIRTFEAISYDQFSMNKGYLVRSLTNLSKMTD